MVTTSKNKARQSAPHKGCNKSSLIQRYLSKSTKKIQDKKVTRAALWTQIGLGKKNCKEVVNIMMDVIEVGISTVQNCVHVQNNHNGYINRKVQRSNKNIIEMLFQIRYVFGNN